MRTPDKAGLRGAAVAIAVLFAGAAHGMDAEVAKPPIVGGPTSPPHRALARKPRAGAAGRPTTTGTRAAAPPPLDLGEAVLRKAIADSRDPLDDVVTPLAAFGAGPGSGPAQQAIDRSFKRADIPTCMTADAFTFDPPQVGPFGLGGLFALPFLVHAIATGKCRH